MPTRALVVTGPDDRFYIPGIRFAEYIEDLGGCAYHELFDGNPTEIQRFVQNHLAAAEHTNALFVFAYIGHGGIHGLADRSRTDSRQQMFRYSSLVSLLAHAQTPVLMVLECCYATYLTPLLTTCCTPSTTGLLIRREPDNEIAVTENYNLLDSLRLTWQRRQHTENERTLATNESVSFPLRRWGAQFDDRLMPELQHPTTISETSRLPV